MRTTLGIDFRDRALAFDVGAAEHLGTLVASRESTGRPIGYPDAQIAGICLSTAATLATRNVKHFADLTLPLINPWET